MTFIESRILTRSDREKPTSRLKHGAGVKEQVACPVEKTRPGDSASKAGQKSLRIAL